MLESTIDESESNSDKAASLASGDAFSGKEERTACLASSNRALLY